jgi:hypothetical protein
VDIFQTRERKRERESVPASIGRTFARLDLFFQMISQKRDNVLVVAVRGDFDVCQNLVKTLMSKESTSQVLASLNSYLLSLGNSN